MNRPKTVGDLIPTRRELLKYGGLGLFGASLEGVWPLKLRAADTSAKTHPRGNARNVIFFEISGAISHLDTFDFKDNSATPKDFQVHKIDTGIYLPVNLFPRMEKVMNRIAIQRSFVSHEEVHLRGQYYVQAGRQLNVAFAREIPSVGSVVASELEKFRRNSDTFPTYVSFNLETNLVGALSTGFLPPRFSVFDLNAQAALTGMSLVAELWQPYVLYGLVAALGMGTAYVPCNTTVVKWFVARRGLAVGLASSGASVGTFALPPLAQLLVTAVGWRTAYVVFGVGIFVLVNLVAQVMRRDPESLGLSPDGARRPPVPAAGADDGVGPLTRAIRTPAFWMLGATFTATWIPVFIPLVHLIPFTRDLGHSALTGAWVVSTVGIGAVAGRLVMGAVSDRTRRTTARTFRSAENVHVRS